MTFSERHFAAASRRVVRRLLLARWFALLGRSALAVYPAACAVAVATWLCGWPRFGLGGAVALTAMWAALAAAWAWFHRPSPVTALARWDEAAGRHEMFASALCFEQSVAPEDGERLHLSRAHARLSADLPALRRHLPARLAPQVLALPLVLLVLVAVLPAAAPVETGDALDEDALAAAREVSAALSRQTAISDSAKGLTADEKQELKKLEAAVQKTADNLRQLEAGSQRDVLSELEQRAHEAEKLAESLQGDGDDPSASKLIAELERHADTTDFASALRGKDMEKSAAEANKLAERLEHKDLTLEERKRLENALNKALTAADEKEKEKERLLSKKLQEAHKELAAAKPREAAKPFRQLAKQYAQTAQRKAAQKQLQQLANQLRSSGQQIFGQQTGAIRRLAQANAGQQNLPAGMRQLGPQQLAQGNASLQQQLAGMRPGQMGPPSGAPQLAMPAGAMPANTPGAPVPGANPGQNPGANPGMAPVPGAGQAPVPGSGNMPGNMASNMPGAGSGMGAGASPVPGTSAGPSPNGAGQGGLHAGRGTAALGGAATKPFDAAGTAAVSAAIGKEGPSHVRSTEPGTHREEARRLAQEVASHTIQAEEESLADEPLPLSRRQQVLRYFTALRRQLVDDPPASTPKPGD